MKQFIHHADKNGLLPVRQSAYRRFHSTESAVLVVHDDIVRALMKVTSLRYSFTRPQLSFRPVDHSTLLSILRSRFSVTEQPLEWFRSYLTGRTQVFTTHSGQTHTIPHMSDVPQPQGSSLGPAQFISYTECRTNLFLTLHSIPHVCRRLTVLQSLCNI